MAMLEGTHPFFKGFRQFEDTLYEKNNRAELTSERAIEEVSRLREHVKALADDRRSDIEETVPLNLKPIGTIYKEHYCELQARNPTRH